MFLYKLRGPRLRDRLSFVRAWDDSPKLYRDQSQCIEDFNTLDFTNSCFFLFHYVFNQREVVRRDYAGDGHVLY